MAETQNSKRPVKTAKTKKTAPAPEDDISCACDWPLTEEDVKRESTLPHKVAMPADDKKDK